MIGGLLFPLVSVGLLIGVAVSHFDSEMPLGLCVSCFMAAVPGGLAPIPLTLLGLASVCFYLGFQQSMPVFVAIMVSYGFNIGVGLPQMLLKLSTAKLDPIGEAASQCPPIVAPPPESQEA